MKQFFISLLLLSFYLQSQNPVLSWAKQIGGPHKEDNILLTVDNQGNVYNTTMFYGTTDFDPGPGIYTLTANNVYDLAICKLDANGNFLWAKQLGGSGVIYCADIDVDQLNNVYVVGGFDGNFDFDPGVGVSQMTSSSNDAFVLKLRPNGTFAWAIKTGGATSDSNSGLAIDQSNNIVVTGAFTGIGDFDPGPGTFSLQATNSYDTFISKIDTSGQLVWAKQFYAANSSGGGSIDIDNAGNIISIGTSVGATDFDPGPGSFILGNANSNLYISKLDQAGNFLFAKIITHAIPSKITADPSGNLLIAGDWIGICDFDPGPMTYTLGAGAMNYFILKLDLLGDFIWVKRSSTQLNTGITGLDTDANGSAYAAIWFVGNFDLDPGPGTFSFTSSNGDIAIIKLDVSGNFLWGGTIGGSSIDQANDLEIDPVGNLYVGGYFRSDFCDLDPGPNSFTLANNSFDDHEVFLNKLSFCVIKDMTNPAALSFCSGNSTTLSAVSPGNISWYSSATSTTSIGSGTLFTTPVMSPGTYTFYAEADLCKGSFDRTAWVVTVHGSGQPSWLSSKTILCKGETASVLLYNASSYTVNGQPSLPNFTISPNITTSYTVFGINTASCSGTAVYTQSVTDCTNIENNGEIVNYFSISPNPVSQILEINAHSETNAVIEIYDLVGKSLIKTGITQQKTKVSLPDLPPGIYVLIIKNETSILFQEKFVKE